MLTKVTNDKLDFLFSFKIYKNLNVHFLTFYQLQRPFVSYHNRSFALFCKELSRKCEYNSQSQSSISKKCSTINKLFHFTLVTLPPRFHLSKYLFKINVCYSNSNDDNMSIPIHLCLFITIISIIIIIIHLTVCSFNMYITYVCYTGLVQKTPHMSKCDEL